MENLFEDWKKIGLVTDPGFYMENGGIIKLKGEGILSENDEFYIFINSIENERTTFIPKEKMESFSIKNSSYLLQSLAHLTEFEYEEDE